MVEKINETLMENSGCLVGVEFVVIHNDAGSMTPEQYIEWLRYREKSLGIAHYYCNRNTIVRVVDTYNIAYHTGDWWSNIRSIGYEVCESMKVSDEEFIENEIPKLEQKYNININDKEAINKKINDLDKEEIESYLSKDFDKDNLLNGEEVRPEINKKGDSYLYVLSDPENPDTDGDGINDDIDKHTDFDSKNDNNLNLISNTEDSDGDGYDDAFELIRDKIDSFGERHLPDRWNLGHRDLLLFADIVYYDFSNNYYGKSLKEIYDFIANTGEEIYILQDGKITDNIEKIIIDRDYSRTLKSLGGESAEEN